MVKIWNHYFEIKTMMAEIKVHLPRYIQGGALPWI